MLTRVLVVTVLALGMFTLAGCSGPSSDTPSAHPEKTRANSAACADALNLVSADESRISDRRMSTHITAVRQDAEDLKAIATTAYGDVKLSIRDAANALALWANRGLQLDSGQIPLDVD